MTTALSTLRSGLRSGFRSGRAARPRLRLPVVLALVASLGLGACATRNAGDKQVGGTVIGAVAGGLAGSAFGKGSGRLIMTGIGTLLGAYVGSEVGQSLDRADRLAAERAAQDSFEHSPSGKTVIWNNPDTGHSGSVTPTRTYQQSSGEYCREYQQTVTVGGKTRDAYGTACRQPDGTWKIVSS
jgi:surface antigen